ncbi:MAG: hypothetical protein CM15mP85_24810 [Rhodobacterales bacterium]|nr:MAG: hypothetical protein CM15mP85_24810 [Rhodobacterales bacterium]
MIKNNYKSSEANLILDQVGKKSAGSKACASSLQTRIIGQKPDLVMHGGVTPPVKVKKKRSFLGKTKQVIHV